MNEKRHGPRLKARSQLLTRATRMPSVHRVRFTPARILLSALSASHSAQLHPADTPPFVSPASPRISPRRPLPPLTHYHRRFDSPPLFSSLLALLLLPLFQFFFYPCISFFFFFRLSFRFFRNEKRKGNSRFSISYIHCHVRYIYIYIVHFNTLSSPLFCSFLDLFSICISNQLELTSGINRLKIGRRRVFNDALLLCPENISRLRQTWRYSWRYSGKLANKTVWERSCRTIVSSERSCTTRERYCYRWLFRLKQVFIFPLLSRNDETNIR